MAHAHIVLVDGSNLVNDVGRLLLELGAEEETVRGYLSDWFDVDRLVQATLSSAHVTVDSWTDLGILIFRSRRQLGSNNWKIAGDDRTTPFWERQASNPGTSAFLVDVPGAREQKEVGVDMSMAIYLFETVDRWDAAVLFTRDSDFVPAVWALRRKGKRVLCSSRPDGANLPLAHACQHFVAWDETLIAEDFEMYALVRPGGLVYRLLTDSRPGRTLNEVRVSDVSAQFRFSVTGADHFSDGDFDPIRSFAKHLEFITTKALWSEFTLAGRTGGDVNLPRLEYLMAGYKRHGTIWK